MRRVVIVLVIVLAVVVVAIVGTQWLLGPRAPVPSLPQTASFAAGSSSPRPVALPDPKRTPGSVNPSATQDNLDATVCKSGWASSQRPPAAYTNALKLVQIVEYGYADKDPRHYQEDHLVPLELGGAPRDPANLWPEPNVASLLDGTAVGSAEKDDLEDYLHSQVCIGAMSLADAQRAMASNWIWRGRRPGDRDYLTVRLRVASPVAAPLVHVTVTGQLPGVVLAPTLQRHATAPLPSAAFGSSPAAVEDPELYCTSIEHEARAAVLTLAVA